MKRALRTLWQFLREISGEAALERRMAQCACRAGGDATKAYEAAVSEQFGAGAHRCC